VKRLTILLIVAALASVGTTSLAQAQEGALQEGVLLEGDIESLFGEPVAPAATDAQADAVAALLGKQDAEEGAASASSFLMDGRINDFGLSRATRKLTYYIGSASSGALRKLESRIADHRAYVATAMEVAGAKTLAFNAFVYESKLQDLFIAKHGAAASQLSAGTINDMYDTQYFYDRMRALGLYRDGGKGSDVNQRDMLIRAQAMFNIPITARLDTTLKQCLIENSNLKPKDYLPADHPTGIWVVINKSYRILTIYNSDKIVRKCPIAVGANVNDTPTGKYTFVSKFIDPRWGGGGYAEPIAGGAPNNPLGQRWIGISKGGGGRYGVHGNASPYSIGTNASHGCVRMINTDVEEIFDIIPINTPVWLGLEGDLEDYGVVQTLEPYTPTVPDYAEYLPPVAAASEEEAQTAK